MSNPRQHSNFKEGFLEGLVIEAAAELENQSAPLLPLLHKIQQHLGYLPEEATPLIANALNVSRADVHGVISFYPLFRSTPPGRYTLAVCQAESCQAAGGRELDVHIRQSLGIDHHQTTADGRFSLEPVYCLGNCACSPSLRIGDTIHGMVNEPQFDRIIANLDENAAATMKSSKGASPATTSSSPENAAPVIYVPRDTTACARGADNIAAIVAATIEKDALDLRLVRNGSRGLYWLEPLLEIELEGARHGFGPVDEQSINGLLKAISSKDPQNHPLYLGKVEDIPFLARQERVTFSRVGITDPLSLADYLAHDGFRGLRNALNKSAQQIVDEIKLSGLRGRGGAAFPAGIKWQTVLDAPGSEKFIVCNADEGDSGTYSDRMLMESDPFCLIEGMIIAGLAVGADTGYIYLREEYPLTQKILDQAIVIARKQGFLGNNIAAQGRAFDIHLRIGAGAYICGEETSMLESLESKRGEVRSKPPLPAIAGLFGKPSVINNVITLASVPVILAEGPSHYQSYGSNKSRGTLPFQLAGNIARGGLVEIPFGCSLRELLQEFGGGSRSGRALRAVQVGGPLAAYIPESQWDTALDYEAFTEIGAMLGHGGIVAFDDTVDMLSQARFSMAFCAHESCGKCTPCRIGSVRGVEVIDRISDAGDNSEERAQYIELLEDLCTTMEAGSMCAMGGLTPAPVRSALHHFASDFGIESAKTDRASVGEENR